MRSLIRASLLILVIVADEGCRDATPTPVVSPAPRRIVVAAGDGQRGPAATVLPDFVEFEVLDANKRPVAGTDVTITVLAGGGNVGIDHAVTDANGTIAVAWTLGDAGDQRLEASAGAATAQSHATACITDCSVWASPDHLVPLTLDTYDGSGQVVHPDVTDAPGIGGGTWLAITPYPFGNPAFENPSVFAGVGSAWKMPDGTSNPVAEPSSNAYLSDPDMVFDAASAQLWLYYRLVISGQNQVLVIRSGDGVHWMAPVTVASAPSHQIVSPTVVRNAPGAVWTMWAVNSGPAGCDAATTTIERRTSSDGLHWSQPVAADLQQPGAVIWHLDVQWIPSRGEYWALYNTYAPGTSCVTDALYLATSSDGLHWTTYPTPLLRSGIVDAFADIVYRSTFRYNAAATTVTFWFSGAKYQPPAGYVWQMETETRRAADVLATVSEPASSLRAPAPVRRNLPPPEPDTGSAATGAR